MVRLLSNKTSFILQFHPPPSLLSPTKAPPPKTASHLRPIIAKAPVPSEGWAEPVVTAEEAEKEVDADFDPYESGDEPEASDDSDFDPSAGGKGKQKKAVVKKKKKPVKGGGGAGAGGKVRKKELDGGEEAWAGNDKEGIINKENMDSKGVHNRIPY